MRTDRALDQAGNVVAFPGRTGEADRGDGAVVAAAKPFRAIAISSGKGGVGKTNLVANLAVALAQRGQRVIVLELRTTS